MQRFLTLGRGSRLAETRKAKSRSLGCARDDNWGSEETGVTRGLKPRILRKRQRRKAGPPPEAGWLGCACLRRQARDDNWGSEETGFLHGLKPNFELAVLRGGLSPRLLRKRQGRKAGPSAALGMTDFFWGDVVARLKPCPDGKGRRARFRKRALQRPEKRDGVYGPRVRMETM